MLTILNRNLIEKRNSSSQNFNSNLKVIYAIRAYYFLILFFFFNKIITQSENKNILEIFAFFIFFIFKLLILKHN